MRCTLLLVRLSLAKNRRQRRKVKFEITIMHYEFVALVELWRWQTNKSRQTTQIAQRSLVDKTE